jgi:hypothetical protein
MDKSENPDGSWERSGSRLPGELLCALPRRRPTNGPTPLAHSHRHRHGGRGGEKHVPNVSRRPGSVKVPRLRSRSRRSARANAGGGGGSGRRGVAPDVEGDRSSSFSPSSSSPMAWRKRIGAHISAVLARSGPPPSPFPSRSPTPWRPSGRSSRRTDRSAGMAPRGSARRSWTTLRTPRPGREPAPDPLRASACTRARPARRRTGRGPRGSRTGR